MKTINDFIRTITNHHLNTRYILTPIAVANFNTDGITIRMVYLFGIRIIRIGLINV